jgi:hypothetical protein
MKRLGRMLVALIAAGTLAAVLLAATAGPAFGDTQTRNLTIHTVGPPQSVDVTCLVPGPDDSCTTLQITVTGTVTSNLAGQGTSQLTLIRTFLDNGCHTGEEFTTFTFSAGTISTHTPTFETCGTPTGLLFDVPFEITGGTGAFAGATGGGQEFTPSGGPSPIIYIGKITF